MISSHPLRPPAEQGLVSCFFFSRYQPVSTIAGSQRVGWFPTPIAFSSCRWEWVVLYHPSAFSYLGRVCVSAGFSVLFKSPIPYTFKGTWNLNSCEMLISFTRWFQGPVALPTTHPLSTSLLPSPHRNRVIKSRNADDKMEGVWELWLKCQNLSIRTFSLFEHWPSEVLWCY